MASERQSSCTGIPIGQAKRSAQCLRGQELGSNARVTSSVSRIGNESLEASDHNETECPSQKAQEGVGKIHPTDLEGVKHYFSQHRSQTGICQSSNHLGKRKQDAQACRVLKPVDPKLTGKPSARAIAGSTSQTTTSTARINSQLAGGRNGTRCPSRQAQGDIIYQELVSPKFQHGGETSHMWIFGAVAELLDNVVDEVPHGATKVLIDNVPNPSDGSPSLLVQDDGGGMDPDSMLNCMTVACPNRGSPNSIGKNGTGFRASVSRLGASAIIFTRFVNTSKPTQSIGLLYHVSGDDQCHKHIIVPMVHYKYNPMTGGIITYEHEPEQFYINMSMLLALSPYISEEELLQNFNDIGPHGTKIIVFNLSCDAKGDLELDFDTDKKDVRISAATMLATNEAVGDQSHLIYQYRSSLRVYVSILYLGLPKHFRIILRGEEVKRRNLATELKHSQCITYRRSMTEKEDEVVLGFLDGVSDVKMDDRFCFYYKQRLIMPFVPICASLDRNRSIVGVLEVNHLKPATNKQDFLWSAEIETLQTILKEKRTEFWKHLKGKELKAAAGQLSLAPPGSHNEANFGATNTTGMHSLTTPFDPAHCVAPTFESSYGGSSGVSRAPAQCLQALPIAATGDRQQIAMAMANAWDQGTSSSRIPAHPATPPFSWNYGGTPSQGIPRAPAPHLPTSAIASAAGDRHRPTKGDVESTNDCDMDFDASSVFATPPACRAPPNGLMRALAPHLASGNGRWPTPASSVAGSAPPLHAKQAAAANAIGSLAPSHSVPPSAMVALRDLPIKMEHGGPLTNDDTAIPPAGVTAAAAAGTAAGVPGAAPANSAAAAAPAPAAGDGGASASPYPWCPSCFKPDDAKKIARSSATHGSSGSSRQREDLQDGSNQGELGSNLPLHQVKPEVSVKIEREYLSNL